MTQSKESASTIVRGAERNTMISVPDYDVFEKIGEGGMARVYRAQHQPLERLVALKVLLPEISQDASFAERFMREAKIAARLVHPHIVQIYDVDHYDSHLYLAMEFVKGGDFSIRISEGASTITLLTAVAELCEALDFAHGEGYIHRDIKPQNILFRTDGSVVLSDFGIARAIRANHNLTQAGMILGTPSYMSPEQAEGHELTGASDLYSAAVLIYEAITGSVPYQSPSPIDILHKHLSAPLPVLPDSMPLLQDFFNKALAKKPEQRFADGADMAHALVQALAGETSLDKLRRKITAWKVSFEASSTAPTAVFSAPLPPVSDDVAKVDVKTVSDVEGAEALVGNVPQRTWRQPLFVGVAAAVVVSLLAVIWFTERGNDSRKVQQLASFDQNDIDSLVDRAYLSYNKRLEAKALLGDQVRRKMALGTTGDQDVDQIINAAIIDRNDDIQRLNDGVVDLVVELTGQYSQSKGYVTKHFEKAINQALNQSDTPKAEWLRRVLRLLQEMPAEDMRLRQHIRSKLLDNKVE